MFLIFSVWPLITRSCMSKLPVNITFASIVNLQNFAKPPVFFFFNSKQLELLLMDIYNYMEFCHQPLLWKGQKVNHLEQHHSFSWQVHSQIKDKFCFE